MMPRFVGLMTFTQDAGGGPAENGIDRYFAWQEELRSSGKLVAAAGLDEAAKLFETHPIAVDGVGMFVVSEVALDLDTPREEHLSRFGLS